MTAGRGVVHSEMPTSDVMKNGGRAEGFQLWVNLPSSQKMIEPCYQDTRPDQMPIVDTDGGKVKVKIIAGSALGEPQRPAGVSRVRSREWRESFAL